MVNLQDVTMKSKKAGRAGVRQEAKAYSCPDLAQDEGENEYEDGHLAPDDIEDEDEEDDLPDPESHRQNNVNQVKSPCPSSCSCSCSWNI